MMMMTAPAPRQPRPYDLADFILTRLHELGITQAEAARRGNLQRATLNKHIRYELRGVPQQETMIGLAKALEVPVTEINLAVCRSLGVGGDRRRHAVDVPEARWSTER